MNSTVRRKDLKQEILKMRLQLEAAKIKSSEKFNSYFIKTLEPV